MAREYRIGMTDEERAAHVTGNGVLFVPNMTKPLANDPQWWPWDTFTDAIGRLQKRKPAPSGNRKLPYAGKDD